jgi:hypothetical protein
MLSKPLTATAISCAIGVGIGFADSAGFYFTLKLFLVNPTTKKQLAAGLLEFFRLLFLVALIILISFDKSMSILWLLIAALPVSMSGKIFCILKRFHG